MNFRVISLLAVLVALFIGCSTPTVPCDKDCEEDEDYSAPSHKNKGSSTPSKNENKGFVCDGRVYCSQMTSYEEALFFIRNCPGTKMDGDGDGVPCESQFGR